MTQAELFFSARVPLKVSFWAIKPLTLGLTDHSLDHSDDKCSPPPQDGKALANPDRLDLPGSKHPAGSLSVKGKDKRPKSLLCLCINIKSRLLH